MSYSTLLLHPGPRVASIVLNRPPLNIINHQMLDELNAVWSDVEDLKAQVVVISGEGDRAFSAGVDVADHEPGKIEVVLEKFHRFILRMRRADCISIAAVHGHTLGGGAELAMSCDLIVAADNTEIGQPEIGLGCYPPVAVAYLPGAIGFHKASEMVLIGEPLAAKDAERIGLINKVVPREQMTGTVDAYVDKLLTKSSVVLALTKRALREGTGRHFEEALDRAHELYVRDLIRTDDMREGMAAFLEKRPPAWKNK
jgi:cyclohexa-1,5-dienecarbonyl-CoA hydratase